MLPPAHTMPWLAQSGVQPAQIAAFIAAAACAAVGLWFLSKARRTAADATATLPVVGVVRRPTLFALGLCVMGVGYHTAAWAGPTWLPLHVPFDRWWIVALVIGITLGVSFLAERLERT